MTNPLEILYRDNRDAAAFGRAYAEHLSEILQRLDYDSVARVIAMFREARSSGNRVFFLGNGGSASTASHFAVDIGIGTRSREEPFRVYSITDNNGLLTAIGNDFSYEEVFSRQLEVLLEPGDVVLAISASGNSANVLKAVEYAAGKGARTVAFVGFDGGRLKDMCDEVVHVVTEKGEYGPAEDVHLILGHIMTTYLIYELAGT